MSRWFATLTSHDPPPVVPEGGGTAIDPMELVDKEPIDKNKWDLASKQEWLPQNLKDLVDKHKPKPADIDIGGKADKERLKEEALKLFGTARDQFYFVNFYQLKQFAQRFADYWGFHLVTANNSCLECFYAETLYPQRPEGRRGEAAIRSPFTQEHLEKGVWAQAEGWWWSEVYSRLEPSVVPVKGERV